MSSRYGFRGGNYLGFSLFTGNSKEEGIIRFPSIFLPAINSIVQLQLTIYFMLLFIIFMD